MTPKNEEERKQSGYDRVFTERRRGQAFRVGRLRFGDAVEGVMTNAGEDGGVSTLP